MDTSKQKASAATITASMVTKSRASAKKEISRGEKTETISEFL